ncbi:unnamed protein product, partial [marine sediment metagenome]
ASIIFAIVSIITSATTHVDSDPSGNEAAEFVYSNLHDMSQSWQSFISSVCSMFQYGWEYNEICWKKRSGRDADPPSQYNDGRIGIRKLPERGQNTLLNWEFDETGGIQGMWQTNPKTFKPTFIPIQKALLFRTQERKGNPEGQSLLAPAYTSYYRLDHIKTFEGVGIERDLGGTAMMKVPIDVFTDSDKSDVLQQCKNLVANARNDEMSGIVTPYDQDNPLAYEFTLLSSPGTRQYDTTEIINRYKNEIASVVLADFINLGHETFGSFALGKSKKDIFEIAILGFLNNIASVLNAYLVPRILALNPEFSGLKEYPVISLGIAKVPSLQDLARILTALAKAQVNFTTSPDTVNRVLEEAGLPPLVNEEEEAD